jgi:hypothetical protein
MQLMLGDDDREVVNQLALPIELTKRPAFFEAVASALADCPGAVHRVARVIQRQFFDPPVRSTDATAPRHHLRRALARA